MRICEVADMRKVKPGEVNTNKTSRETYKKYIGNIYEVGQYKYMYVYNAWDPDTNKKQYVFHVLDEEGRLESIYVADYKGFREVIDGKN